MFFVGLHAIHIIQIVFFVWYETLHRELGLFLSNYFERHPFEFQAWSFIERYVDFDRV